MSGLEIETLKEYVAAAIALGVFEAEKKHLENEHADGVNESLSEKRGRFERAEAAFERVFADN